MLYFCENLSSFLLFIIFIVSQHQVSSITVNYVIVAGGINSGKAPVSVVQAYRVETGQWHYGYQLEMSFASTFHQFLQEPDRGFQILNTGQSLIKVGGRTDYFQIINWRTNPVRRPLLAPGGLTRHAACGVVHHRHAYLFGGLGAERTISRLDDNSDWIHLQVELPEPRLFCGAATYQNDIYICGGQYPNNFNGLENKAKFHAGRKCFKYSVHRNQIEVIRSMHKLRTGSFLVVHGTYLYAAGGYAGTVVERYDLAPGSSSRWIELPARTMCSERRYSMAVSDGYNRVYLMGGMTPENATDCAEFYDSEKKRWFQAESMPLAVASAAVLRVDFPERSN